MKIKLDETFGRRGYVLLSEAGHDVSTVREQDAGAADSVLFTACADEGRVLLTLDRDFAQTLRFPPGLRRAS